jgi:hypothetical protein
MDNNVILVFAVGSIIVSVIASLKCIKTCSGLCFKIETVQNVDNVSEPTIRKTALMDLITQRITPRPAPNSRPPVATSNSRPIGPVAVLVDSLEQMELGMTQIEAQSEASASLGR